MALDRSPFVIDGEDGGYRPFASRVSLYGSSEMAANWQFPANN